MSTATIQLKDTTTTVDSIESPRIDRPVAALIGGGKISEQHLIALRKLDDVRIGGVCDLSPALARFTAERFDVDEWYADYRDMLDQCPADVVHVLTPPATHDRIVRDCLDAGRHVIVEKPIALSNDAFRRLWDDAASRGLWLIENQNYRFNEPIERISRAIADGRIGTVQEVEVRMVLDIRSGGRYADANLPHPSHRLPAGIIHEFITHLTYLMLEFLPQGSMDVVDSVRAAWRNHGADRDDLFSYDDLDATVLAGAAHGRIRFSCRQWPDCLAVTVRGSDGVAAAEVFHPMTQVITRRSVGQHLTPLVNSLAEAKAKTRSGFGSIWRKVRNRTAYEGLERFVALTYDAIRKGDVPPVGYDHIDETSRLIDAMLAPENRI